MFSGRDIKDVDLKYVAGLRTGNVDRAVDLIKGRGAETAEGRDRCGWGDLTIRCVEAGESDSLAGSDAEDGRDAIVDVSM